MNRKFDQCVSQKDVTSCRRDIVTSDTSDLYDYPFNLEYFFERNFYHNHNQDYDMPQLTRSNVNWFKSPTHVSTA